MSNSNRPEKFPHNAATPLQSNICDDDADKYQQQQQQSEQTSTPTLNNLLRSDQIPSNYNQVHQQLTIAQNSIAAQQQHQSNYQSSSEPASSVTNGNNPTQDYVQPLNVAIPNQQQNSPAVSQPKMSLQQSSAQQLHPYLPSPQQPGYPPGMYQGYWTVQPSQQRYMHQGNSVSMPYYQPQINHPAYSCFPPNAGRGMQSGKVLQPPSIQQTDMQHRIQNGPGSLQAEWTAKMAPQQPLKDVRPQTGIATTSSASGPQSTSSCSTSAGLQTAPSPSGASSVIDESLDGSKSPISWPRTPAQLSQGQFQRTPVGSVRSSTPAVSMKSKEIIIDRLVGVISSSASDSYTVARKTFFEKLVSFLESQNEPITQIPQVSKQPIDLHRLYIAVRQRGGFEQVTREKTWKQICTEANPEMSESSAAGYQLRRHYQRYLLALECLETGKSASEAVAFAEKLKKKKRNEKDSYSQQFSGQGPSAPHHSGPPSYGSMPSDPSVPYYYNQLDASSQMQVRQQLASNWAPSQGYPSITPVYSHSMRPAPPSMRSAHPIMQQTPTFDEQQRYEERHHYYQQQHATYVPHQQHVSRVTTPSTSLQGDCNQSRSSSTGPQTRSITPDPSSRLPVDESLSSHRPPSQTPCASQSQSLPTNLPQQQQHPSGFYAHSSLQKYSLGVKTGLPASSVKQVGATYMPFAHGHPASYPPLVHGYVEGYQTQAHIAVPTQQHGHFQHQHQHQVWAPQQIQRYPAVHSSCATSSAAAASMSCGTRPSASDLSAHQPFMPPRRAYLSIHGSQSGLQQPGAQRLRYSSSGSPTPHYPPHVPYTQSSIVSRVSSPRGESVLPQTSYLYSQSAASGLNSMLHPNVNVAPTGYQNSALTSGVSGNQSGITSNIGVGPPAASQFPSTQQLHFPVGCIEATTVCQRKRKKFYAKDLNGAELNRIVMALRSGMDVETVWALNVLNIYLHDDSALPINVKSSFGLLNILVKLFQAYLAILYPTVFENRLKSDDEMQPTVNLLKSPHEEYRVKDMLNIRPVVNSTSSLPKNYTKISRTGRIVQVQNSGFSSDSPKRLDGEDRNCVNHYPFENNAAAYFLAQLKRDMEFKNYMQNNKLFSQFSPRSTVRERNIHVVSDYEKMDKSMRIIGDKVRIDYDDDNVELKVLRCSAVLVKNEYIEQTIKRCLSISNIIRAFSFLSVNDEHLSKHADLLYIVGRLLRLYADEQQISFRNYGSEENGSKEDVSNEEMMSVALTDQASECGADDLYLLMEAANQLRDDAFVFLSNLSPSLDLFEFDSDISWPIFDGLIYWSVSNCAEAKDPFPNSFVSPRNYALDAFCKMSVIQTNVDLLVSTGPYYRLEKLIKVLATLIDLNEEQQIREYSIVILHAICSAYDYMCYIAAAETPAIPNIVQFLEILDSNMHQVAQQRGMQVLRDNPDMMGTSIGMLRRSALLLQCLCGVEACRRYFVKYQSRLLQFTISHLMDSRVGSMISGILCDVALYVCSRSDDKEDEFSVILMHSPPDGSASSGSEKAFGDTKSVKAGENSVTASSEDEGSMRDVKLSTAKKKKSELRVTSVKRRRLGNGVVHNFNRNRSSDSAIPTIVRPLSNGELTATSVKSNQNLQSITSRKSSNTVENGKATAPTGSVQAVA